MPLNYNVQNEVMMDRFNAPTWKRENEPFTMDIVLDSTNAMPVTGKLTVRHGSELLDLDPDTPGMQPVRLVTLKPGLNVEHVFVPPLGTTGVHQFVANFEGDNVTVENGKAGAKTASRGGYADCRTTPPRRSRSCAARGRCSTSTTSAGRGQDSSRCADARRDLAR